MVLPQQKAYIGLDKVEIIVMNPATLGLNVYMKNSSPIAATNEYGLFRTIPVAASNQTPDAINAYPTKRAIEKEWGMFEKFFNSTPINERRTLGPGEGMWGSTKITNFDKVQGDLTSGTQVILIMTASVFSDGAGRHRIDGCDWVQPPITSQPPVVHSCGIHDAIRY